MSDNDLSDDDLSDTYKQLKARQIRAEADPLEVGVSLAWSGPSLEPNITPPSDYPHHRSASPNPLRQFHSILLDPREGVTARTWTLKLVEPLKPGVWQFSQVWRVEATLEGQPSMKIPLVVKLYQEALYPIPREESERESRGFVLPPEVIAKEARAYRLVRDSQGSDIPLCYGFFNFQLPSGEVTVGLVLEDLVEQRKGITVEKFLEREAKGKRLTFEAIDRIMSAALRLQKRLNENDLAHILFRLDQLVLLRSTDPYKEDPLLIGFGFSRSSTKAIIDDEYERGEINIPRWRWMWQKTDQMCLFGEIPLVFGASSRRYEKLAREWQKKEKERKKLNFLWFHQILPEQPEEPEEVDPEEEERERKAQVELQEILGAFLGD